MNLGLTFRPDAQWDFTIAGTVHSGRPTTPTTAETHTLPDGSLEIVPVTGPRNSLRLPAYHRLDFGIGRSLRVRGTTLRASLNVTNVLDRENICCVDGFDFAALPDGSVEVQRRARHGLPRLITFGLSWTF